MLAGVLASCGSLAARRGIARDPEAANIEVTLTSDAVPAIGGEPLRSEEGNFYLVRNADGIMAVSFRCTHQGCAAPWKVEQQRFVCPCHNSAFDRNGLRVQGPAPRPLDLMAVTVLPGGDVVVDTKQVAKRKDYDATQATPYPG